MKYRSILIRFSIIIIVIKVFHLQLSSSNNDDWFLNNLYGKLLSHWLNTSNIHNDIKLLDLNLLEYELSQCNEYLFEHILFIEHCKQIARWSIEKFYCTYMVGLNCRLAVYYLDRYDNPDTYHRFVSNFTSISDNHSILESIKANQEKSKQENDKKFYKRYRIVEFRDNIMNSEIFKYVNPNNYI